MIEQRTLEIFKEILIETKENENNAKYVKNLEELLKMEYKIGGEENEKS